MINGLLSAIQDQVDPFYRNPIDEERYNLIYIIQQPAMKELIELGRRPVCAFVGQTKDDETINNKGRYNNGDYCKWAEKRENSSWRFSRSSFCSFVY